MIDLTKQEDFEEWLRTQSRDICIVIAVRAALRAFPVLAEEFGRRRKNQIVGRDIVLPVVRALASALAVAKYPTKNDELSSYVAAAAYAAKIADLKAYTAARAADIVDSNDTDDTAYLAADTVSHAAQDAGSNIPIYAFAAADARLVNDGESASTLAKQPLWIDRTFEWASGLWPRLRISLHNLEENWDVWTRWYDAVLEGRPTLGGEVLDIFRATLPEEDWAKGPAHVNALIKAEEEKGTKRREQIVSVGQAIEIDTAGPVGVLKGSLAKDEEIAGKAMTDGEKWAATQAPVQFPLNFRASSGTAGTSFSQATSYSPPPLPLTEAADSRSSTGTSSPPIPDISGLEVPQQTKRALVFGSIGDGPIDIIKNEGANQIADTQDSRDSHSEVLRLTAILIELHESGKESPNNGNALAYQECILLRESIGLTIRDVRPALLIPRGEALRQRLSRNIARNELTDIAPLSDSMESAVSNVVKAYNGFVGLDPELSRRDEASFGPDAERNLIPPDKGQELAKSARESGVITVDAELAIGEEGKVAPLQPDPTNRSSRRFSEGVKNLFRATISKAVGLGRWVKANQGKLATGAGTTYITAQWVLAHEQWLLELFADHPAMLEVIKSLIGFLKTLPL